MTEDPTIPAPPEPPVSEAEAARLRLLDEKLQSLDAKHREIDERLRQLNDRVDILDPYHGLDWNSGSQPDAGSAPEIPEAVEATGLPADPVPVPEEGLEPVPAPPPPRDQDLEQEEDGEDDEGGSVKMALWQHLEELRWMLMKALLCIVVCGAIGLYFSNHIQRLILAPVHSVNQPRNELVWQEAWHVQPGGRMEQEVTATITQVNAGINIEINNDKPTAAFMASLQIGLVAGLFLALPFVVYCIWTFVSPGLREQEQRAAVRAASVGTIMFLIGCVFGYGFLYLGIPVLASFAQPDTVNIWPYPDYLWFCFMMIAAFGLVFEMPVILVLLVRLGVVSTATLSAGRRYAIVINLVIAAILTPTADIFNMMCMACPMLFLYEASIWIGRYYERQAARREAAEAEADE